MTCGRTLLYISPQNQICSPICGHETSIIVNVLVRWEQQFKVSFALELLLVVCQLLVVIICHVYIPILTNAAKGSHPLVNITLTMSPLQCWIPCIFQERFWRLNFARDQCPPPIWTA